MPSVRRSSLTIVLALVALSARPAAGQTVTRAAAQSPPSMPVASSDPESEPARNGFWWALGDTTLDRLLDQALRGSPELAAAGARMDGAGASRLEAALDMAPVVTASAGYTRRRFASAAFPGAGPGALPDQDVWASGLTASWEVDVFGRLRRSYDARDAVVESAIEGVRDVRVSVSADVARSYFALRGTQNRLAVATRNLENQRRTYELTRQRLEAGRGTEFDTERARAQLNSTLAAIPLLEERIAATQYRIAVIVGRPPTEVAAELEGHEALPTFPQGVPAADPTEVVRARPDVRAAEGLVAASEALTSAARADYLPRVSLVAGAGYSASAVDRFGNAGTFNYAIGPVISWAAFDVGRVKARVDEARAIEAESRAYHEQAVLHARAELEAASVHYRTARARLGYLREAAVASERAASLAALRYEGGVADFLQVLDAERTLLAAQDQLAEGQTRAAEAYVALYQARAGHLPPPR